MDLAADITPEDLKVFLEEAEEQLQLLDDDILRLERDGASEELLQEIFRAAHTLKGSAATIGHGNMAAVGHASETLLDRLRNGELAVNTEIVNALLHSLDVLRAFKDELSGEADKEPDIEDVIAELEAASGEPADAVATADPLPLTIDHDTVAAILEAEAAGDTVYRLTVRLLESCEWLTVRTFQVVSELSSIGNLLACSPTSTEIEAEIVGRTIDAIVITEASQEALTEALMAVQDVESVEFTEVSREVSPAEDAESSVPTQSVEEESSGRTQRNSQTVRIDVERLDNLANMIGELVIDRTRIGQIGRILSSRYKDDELVESLSETASHLSKVVSDLQEDIMQARMLPVGTVFRRFNRMVRDLALTLNKRVEFVTDGEDTEIDRTVVERIYDPLVHLLRNAVDHGIESPEDRLASGKPETATLRLSAYHEHGYIAISVKDDGGGIDTGKLKQSVVARGLETKESVSRMSHSEAVNLIFLPGLSTADETTEVSGRGVGMDIVRANIESINGSITVETAIGVGTELILRLPLTLATVDSLLVKVGKRDYALPLVYVTETIKISQHTLTTVGGRTELLTIRDRVIPLVRLHDIWPGGSGAGKAEDAVFAVIVNSGDKQVALGVDSLTEPQEIVVKSLGGFVGDVKGISGASILGDGRVVLIADVASLVSAAGRRPQRDDQPQDGTLDTSGHRPSTGAGDHESADTADTTELKAAA
ncbi:MAG: chemotaxis protein CheA [Chloroflexi bacterium]|nr:chemotaxis protein CheA [Chloroflexota bacterium]